jgi:tetratricopeptide (TPR) repeat protein
MHRWKMLAPVVAGVALACTQAGGPAPPRTPQGGAAAVRPAGPSDAERKLAEAEAELARHPESADAWIWKGRRLGYLGRYDEAIAVYTAGLERFPTDARFLRHRGHRWLSKRDFARAEADLERAWAMEEGRPDAIEPDGLPNAANIPTSTLQGNIGYHWGLAVYLQGRWGEAAEIYQKTLPRARHPDMEVAVRYWWTLALRRADRPDEARRAMSFSASQALLESFAYERLLALFRGEIAVAELWPPRPHRSGSASGDTELDHVTVGYGVAAHLQLEGQRGLAQAIYEELTRPKDDAVSAAFGVLAAEADLQRLLAER